MTTPTILTRLQIFSKVLHLKALRSVGQNLRPQLHHFQSVDVDLSLSRVSSYYKLNRIYMDANSKVQKCLVLRVSLPARQCRNFRAHSAP
jgi:hypothetical protein